jgi:hypothetical protein
VNSVSTNRDRRSLKLLIFTAFSLFVFVVVREIIYYKISIRESDLSLRRNLLFVSHSIKLFIER